MGDPGCLTWSLKLNPVSITGTCLRIVTCPTLFGLLYLAVHLLDMHHVQLTFGMQ